MAIFAQYLKPSSSAVTATIQEGDICPNFGPTQSGTALIIADAVGDQDALCAMAAAAGLRILSAVSLDAAMARLDQTVAVDVILLVAPDHCEPFAPLLSRLDALAQTDHVAVVMALSAPTLEAGFGQATARSVHILCDPDPLDMTLSLVAALQAARHPVALHDSAHVSEAERLQRLTQEVSRIARTLAHLSSGAVDGSMSTGNLIMNDYGHPVSASGSARYQNLSQPSDQVIVPDQTPDVTAEEVRAVLRVRRLRDNFFAADLFADPAWDMLLDLMAARLAGERVSVSSLCIAAAVPATTALRWIRSLTDQGVLVRQADPDDARRVFIALSDDGAASMTEYMMAARRIRKTLP